MVRIIYRYWLAIFFCVAFTFFNLLNLKADLPVDEARTYLVEHSFFTQEDLDGLSMPDLCGTCFGAHLSKIDRSLFRKKPKPNEKKKAYYYLIVLAVNESTPEKDLLNEFISSSIERLKKFKGDSVTETEITELEKDFSEASDSEGEMSSRDSFSSQSSETF